MQRIADCMAHIGRPHVGHQGAVGETDHGVDHGFGMNQHFDLPWRDAKIFSCFNKFHGLVKHGSGIDGDALPHVPVGMGRGLRQGCLFKVLNRPVAEGPPTRGDDDPLHRGHVFPHQRLEDRRMFAVHRKKPRPTRLGCRKYQGPGANQRFLVCKRQRRPLLKRPQPGREPRRADDRGHDPVRRPRGSLRERRGSRRGFDPGALQRVAQVLQQILARGDRDVRTKASGIRRQLADIGCAGQRNHVIVLRRTLDQIDRILTYGSRRSEYADAAHDLSTKSVRHPEEGSDDKQKDGRSEHAIVTIQ